MLSVNNGEIIENMYMRMYIYTHVTDYIYLKAE